MTELALIAYLLAGLLTLLAFVTLYRSGTKELSEKTTRHFASTARIVIGGRESREQRRRSSWMQKLFWRAGMEWHAWQVYVAMLLTLLLSVLATLWHGWPALIGVPMLMMLSLYVWLAHRAQGRIKAILYQLPLFLDQVLRAIGTGRSMEGALALATREAAQPLRDIFERVLLANRLGEDLGESIQEAAELYRVQELYLLSLAIRVNRSYGSSVRELLNNIVKMIHDREAARRELRTLTGETRVTAWVLGLLPVLIVGYIMMMNPGYMLVMWEDGAGRIMMLMALLLQLTGAFVLWRMIKRI